MSILASAVAAIPLWPKRLPGETPDSAGSVPSIRQGRVIQIALKDPRYKKLSGVGSAVYVDVAGEKNPIIVYRSAGDKVAAYSSTCGHKGCRVDLPKKGKVKCPCHGAAFTTEGRLLKGPAQTDLKAYPAELIEGTILIRMDADDKL